MTGHHGFIEFPLNSLCTFPLAGVPPRVGCPDFDAEALVVGLKRNMHVTSLRLYGMYVRDTCGLIPRRYSPSNFSPLHYRRVYGSGINSASHKQVQDILTRNRLLLACSETVVLDRDEGRVPGRRDQRDVVGLTPEERSRVLRHAAEGASCETIVVVSLGLE